MRSIPWPSLRILALTSRWSESAIWSDMIYPNCSVIPNLTGAMGGAMKATERLHDLGQSLWLDNITRGLLTKGTLRRYIDELSVSTSRGTS